MTRHATRQRQDAPTPAAGADRLLVVADTPSTADALVALAAGVAPVDYVPSDAHQAVDAAVQRATLLVLDLDSATTCGYATLERLRGASVRLPIVAISATGDEAAAIRAFDNGADAVLTAPVDPCELLARCRALLRRRAKPVSDAAPDGRLRFAAGAAVASVGTRELKLSAMQFAVLELLARRPGQVVTRQMLLDQLYGGIDTPAAGVIDFFVHAIRRELAASGSATVVETLRGVGFRLSARADG